MNNEEYRAFLDLLMCSDPWPLPVSVSASSFQSTKEILWKFANKEAKARGFIDWFHAYHEHYRIQAKISSLEKEVRELQEKLSEILKLEKP